MKTTMKTALAAAMVAGTVFAAAPADARVSVGIGIGVPGPYYADPCYGPYPYPSYCTYPVFYGPVYYNGAWVRGPIRYRVINGHRHFWVHGGWHRDLRVGHGHWGGPHHGNRGHH